MPPEKLSPDFYKRTDVAQISKELLGKVLCTRFPGETLTSGIITETEAYCGRNDKASHAYNGRRTGRTEIMYQPGGVAYVYLCYGIHHLFNVVTNVQDKADAVLIRAVKPLDGTERILSRRKADTISPQISAGPGRLTNALGITTNHSGTDLQSPDIWIEDRGVTYNKEEIVASPRIGVDYAEEDAERPWRFYLKESRWVSS